MTSEVNFIYPMLLLEIFWISMQKNSISLIFNLSMMSEHTHINNYGFNNQLSLHMADKKLYKRILQIAANYVSFIPQDLFHKCSIKMTWLNDISQQNYNLIWHSYMDVRLQIQYGTKTYTTTLKRKEQFDSALFVALKSKNQCCTNSACFDQLDSMIHFFFFFTLKY